jgi:aldose 1-epimerase
MSGAVLAPWPNRVEDAVWSMSGRTHHLPVTEPDLGHALHGLLAQADFEVVMHGTDHVELACPITAQPGYPFSLCVIVAYTLRDDGIEARVTVVNEGCDPAPVAVGSHPYLRVGDWPLDDLVVELDVDAEWLLDERHIPRRRELLQGSGRDPRAPAEIRSHTLFERETDRTDNLVHTLTAPDGTAVELVADHRLRWTQWYVSPALDTEAGPRRALAVEPMSAPPNALRTGESIATVRPRGRVHWTWEIRRVQRASRVR